MTAYDGAGKLLADPWSCVGTADPALATSRGNPSRSRLQRFGDAPTGVFEIVDRVPPPENPQLLRMLGAFGAFVLRPVSGQAAEADANGRTSLMIHGGPDAFAATDGSLRIPEQAMEVLARSIPENPGSMRPRIRVHVGDCASSEQAEGRRRIEPSSITRNTGAEYHQSIVYGGFSDNLGMYLVLYQQLYLWPSLEDALRDDSGDEAAANALRDQGFTVPLEDHSPVVEPGHAPSDPPPSAVADEPDMVPEPPPAPPAPPVSTPRPDDRPISNEVDPGQGAMQSIPDYTPSGGAYDR